MHVLDLGLNRSVGHLVVRILPSNLPVKICRARQVIDKRFINQIDLDEIEDTEDLIEFSKEDFDKEKPMMKAFKEFLNDELECTNKSSDDSLNGLDD